MLNYIIKRFLYSILIIAGVVLLTFGLFRVAAGDPAAGCGVCPRLVENIRRGLDALHESAEIPAKWRTQAREYFRDIKPVSTMVGVATLIDPDWVVEIEADAVVAPNVNGINDMGE